jgi:hypothetical protein
MQERLAIIAFHSVHDASWLFWAYFLEDICLHKRLAAILRLALPRATLFWKICKVYLF